MYSKNSIVSYVHVNRCWAREPQHCSQVFHKMVVLKIPENSQESICYVELLMILQPLPYSFTKERTLPWMLFSRNFLRFFKQLLEQSMNDDFCILNAVNVDDESCESTRTSFT